MPTRHFDKFDMTDIVGVPSDGSFSPTVFNDTGFGTVTAFNTASAAAVMFTSFGYTQSGTIDFTHFPGIPAGALISRIEIHSPSSAAVSLSGDGAVGFAELNGVSPNNGDLTLPEVVFAPGAAINHTFSVPGVTVVDFTPPITRDVLIATYAVQVIGLGFDGLVNTGLNNTIVATLSLTGFDFAVTYTATNRFIIQDEEIPVGVGDRVVITTDPQFVLADDPNPPPPLDQVEQIVLEFDDHIIILFPYQTYISVDDEIIYGYNFVTIIAQEVIWFDLPLPIHKYKGPLTVSVIYFPGTQFSGSVLIGTLDILYEDASGIYKLEKTQTHDTLYFREGSISDVELIFLQSLLWDDNNLYDDDFFSLMPYPIKILSQTIYEEDNGDEDQNNFTPISIQRDVFELHDVYIPSPFIKTAFIP